ncbi:unnamed protein product [Bemisia tabaci]|uniref:CCHC-type domain-containing protein n=1 Tax=Bemisia tabaci TaxID=7038 RepID=A0A9P0F1D0_BEMTA|nr:unnamed protein product [Bemisia tabaci]
MESNNPNKRIILESIERGKLSKEQIIEKIGNIQKRSAVTITIEGVTKDSTSDFPENDPRNIGNLEVEQDTRIIRSRDLELEQEINKISLQLASLSDSTKDKNMVEEKRNEIKRQIDELECKKEMLTQKLSYYDPKIAAQFRTSTPTGLAQPMDVEEDLHRKRNASSSELNRSFSDSDLTQTSKKWKDGNIISWMNKNPKKTDNDGFTLVRHRRKNLNTNSSNPNSQPQSRESGISNTKIPKKLKTAPQQERNQNIPLNSQVPKSTVTPPENEKHATSKEERNPKEDIWNAFKDEQICTKLNMKKQDFVQIIEFYTRFQNSGATSSKDMDQHSINKEIQAIMDDNKRTSKKVDDTLSLIKEINKTLMKNTNILENKMNKVDKTVQSLELQQKKEAKTEKASYASTLAKIDRANQIAAKSKNNFIMTLHSPREIPKTQELLNKFVEISSTFMNTKVIRNSILSDKKSVRIEGTTDDRESLRVSLENELKKWTAEENITSALSTQSEVMKITGLRNTVSDEQIYSLILDNMNDPSLTRENLNQNATIFRKVNSFVEKSKMIVYMRVRSPLLEKITRKRTFYSKCENWGTILITPIIYISQCPKCFEFGHGPLKCRKGNVCRKCGSTDHLSAECKESKRICFICKQDKNKKHFDHACTDRECPTREEMYQRELFRCSRQVNRSIFQEMQNQSDTSTLTQNLQSDIHHE